MGELDNKEIWVLKNWCFWTVVLEETVESPLDSKEIKPVIPKWNRSWIFMGMTEAEAAILWPPDVKNWLIGKDPDAGKDWRLEKKGMTEWDGWMASPTQWTWVWTHSVSWWWTGKPGVLQSMGTVQLQKVRHDWATELNWWGHVEMNGNLNLYLPLWKSMLWNRGRCFLTEGKEFFILWCTPVPTGSPTALSHLIPGCGPNASLATALSHLRSFTYAVFPRKISLPLISNNCNTSFKSQQKHPISIDTFLNPAPQSRSLCFPFKPCLLFLRKHFGIVIDLHTSKSLGIYVDCCKIHMIGHRWTLETEGKVVLIVSLRTFLQHNVGGFSSSPVKYREMF